MPKKPGDGKKKWTKKDLDLISRLAGIGLSQTEIASYFNRSIATFQRHMRENESIRQAWDTGRATAHAKIASKAFEMAASGNSPSMTQYWLNARAGWKSAESEDLASAAKNNLVVNVVSASPQNQIENKKKIESSDDE